MMTEGMVRERDLAGLSPTAHVIDTDVHATLPSVEALLQYLPEQWREYVSLWGSTYFFRPSQISYPPGAPTSRRPTIDPTSTGSTASGLAALRRDVLDSWDVSHAIVSCPYFVDMFHNPYVGEAMAMAANDWLLAEWLDPEPRLRGSIIVPASQPAMAVREIERVGGHPGVVQVVLPVRSARPYGNAIYHPIFEAAAAQGLVVGLHHGGWPGNAPTGVGWPSFYIEEWVGRAAHFQSQLMSLITEGVFARVPDLRVALIEAGWSWLPAFLWRFDKDWKGLRRETPWVDRLPSAYVRDHVKLTLQPYDGPSERRHLELLYNQLDSDELLMFSTDYPHWQYDDPADAIPPGLTDDALTKLLYLTAREFYRLEDA